MKAKDIGEMKISFYKRQTDKTGEVITLKEYLIDKPILYKMNIDILRSETNEEYQKNWKRNMLPCGMISGIGGSDKSRDNMIKKNNIIFLDMDYQDNPTFHSEQILLTHAYNILKEPYVYAVGRSCRNNGLFCIILVEDIEKIEQYYQSLKRIFAEKFTIVLDDKCSNSNRAKFITYDEKVLSGEWIKEDEEEIIPFNVIDTCSVVNELKFPKNNIPIPLNSLLNNDLFIIKCIIKLVKDCNYQSNDYYDWLKDGFRLATLDYKTGFLLFLLISKKSQGYKNDREVERKFKECCLHTKFNRSCMSHYFKLLKDKIGDNWKAEVEKSHFASSC